MPVIYLQSFDVNVVLVPRPVSCAMSCFASVPAAHGVSFDASQDREIEATVTEIARQSR